MRTKASRSDAASASVAREPRPAPALGLVFAARRRRNRSGAGLRPARGPPRRPATPIIWRPTRSRAGACRSEQPANARPSSRGCARKGLLTPALLEARARAALAADNPTLAREFIAEVPAERAAALNLWLQLLESPKSSLTTLAMTPQTAVETDALARRVHAAFQYRRPRRRAASALAAVATRHDAGGARPTCCARLRLAKPTHANPGAVAAFDAVPAENADTQVQEWRVRAALWAANYAQGARVDGAHAGDALESAALALLARPRVAATSGAEAAAPLFAEIAGTARLLRLSGRGPAAAALQPQHSPRARRCLAAKHARRRSGTDPRACALRLRHDGRCRRRNGMRRSCRWVPR